jgi:hypothetical protein
MPSLSPGILLLLVSPAFATVLGPANLWQRVLVGLIFLWEEAMGLRMFIVSGKVR